MSAKTPLCIACCTSRNIGSSIKVSLGSRYTSGPLPARMSARIFSSRTLRSWLRSFSSGRISSVTVTSGLADLNSFTICSACQVMPSSMLDSSVTIHSGLSPPAGSAPQAHSRNRNERSTDNKAIFLIKKHRLSLILIVTKQGGVFGHLFLNFFILFPAPFS